MKNEMKKILQHHVSVHHSEVDPEEIWAGIVKKQKRKKKSWLLYLLPLILIIFGFLSVWITVDADNTAHEQLLSQVESETKSETQAVISTSPAVTSATSTTKVADTKSTPATIQISIPTNFSNTSKTTRLSRNSINNNNTNFDKVIEALSPESPSKNDINFAIKKKKAIASSDSDLLLSLPMITSEITVDDRPIITVSGVAQLPTEILDIPSIQLQQLATLRLMSGIAYVSYSIVPNKQLAPDYIAARRNTETALEAVTGKFGIDLPIGKGFTLGSGINYIRINEKFDWQGSYLSDISGNPLAGLKKDNEGNPLINLAFYTDEFYEAVEQKIVSYNKHEFLTIPFILGYHKNLGKFRTKVNLGAGITVMSHSTGQVLNEDLIPAYLSDNNTKTGVQYVVGLGFDYPITRFFAVSSQIEFAAQTVTTFNLAKKYNSYALHLGVSYSLK